MPMTLRTLYQTLLDSDMARLRVIAQQWDIPLLAERRADLAAELADAMAQAEPVARMWPALPDDQRAALEDLLRHGGALPWAAFTRRWGQVRPVGPGRLEREELWRTPISPAEGLWYWGLMQRAFVERAASGGRDTTAQEIAFVPEELRLYLPTPAPLTLPAPPPAPPARHLLVTGALADDLTTLWAAVQQEPIALDDAGQWPTPRRAALLTHFTAPDAARLALLETLSLEQGWLIQDERHFLRLAAKPALLWLQASAWEQWEILARAWLTSARWNDLEAVLSLRPDPLHGWPVDSRAARQGFLDLLRQCAPGAWYSFEAFIPYAREYATDFLRPDGDYDAWTPRDAQSGAALGGFAAWDAVEGALIAFYLNGPLAWLGIVELGSAWPGSAPGVFRLSAAGAALLRLSATPSFPDPPPAQLHSSGRIEIPAARRYERFQLSRIAQAVRRSESDYSYRLTPATLARARQQRIPVERIVAFLGEILAAQPPESLVAALNATYAQGERAQLAPLWVLRADPQILALPALRRWLVEEPAPGVGIIRTADRERVLTILIQEGILPEYGEAL